jgi:hypothetical protein
MPRPLYPLRKGLTFQLYRKLGEYKGQFGGPGEENIFLPLWEVEYMVLQPVASPTIFMVF